VADLTITAADVAFVDRAGTRTLAQAGEAATQGEPCYLHTDGKYYRTDANDGEAKADCAGVWMNKVAINEFGYVAGPNTRVRIGATLTAATDYYVSANVGKICVLGDLTSGQYVKKIGTAEDTAILAIDPSHNIPTV
jgi:hypothetical protein